ncbi:MAG: DUF58 domain-containing protein [Planctomycetota bacterium]
MPEQPLFDEQFLRKLEYLRIVAKKVFSGQFSAERRAKKIGSGLEFADHRDYAPGDDFRYLDWNLYGRLEKLLLRLFEEEEDLSITFLLDVSRSMFMGSPVKADYARRVAAALAYVGLANLDRVTILPFSAGLSGGLAPKRGKRQVFAVLEYLAGLQPGGVTDLEGSFREFVHRTRRRGLAVVLSDFFDARGFERGLNYLRYNRFDVYVVQVLDAAELSPRIAGDMRMVDVETGDAREVTVSPAILAEYARRMRTFCDALERYCRESSLGYVRAVTSVPVDVLVLSVFRAGGFLR